MKYPTWRTTDHPAGCPDVSVDYILSSCYSAPTDYLERWVGWRETDSRRSSSLSSLSAPLPRTRIKGQVHSQGVLEEESDVATSTLLRSSSGRVSRTGTGTDPLVMLRRYEFLEVDRCWRQEDGRDTCMIEPVLSIVLRWWLTSWFI